MMIGTRTTAVRRLVSAKRGKRCTYSASTGVAVAAAIPAAPSTTAGAAAATVAVSVTRGPRAAGGVARRAWDGYTRSLSARPLATKATMAAFIFFCSDSATQYLMRDSSDDGKFVWDPSRALSGSAFGIVATTWMHGWWGFLEKFVGARVPVANYRLANALTKVAIDQCVGAPLYVYSYYVVTNILGKLSDCTDPTGDELSKAWKDTNDKACSMMWPTMTKHWRVWPAVHSLNFYFVPLHHRILVQNTALVGWSGYLSYLNHSQDDERATASVAAEAPAAVAMAATATAAADSSKLTTPVEEVKKRKASATVTRRQSVTVTTRRRHQKPAATTVAAAPATANSA